MKRSIFFFIIVVMFISIGSASAEPVRQITWAELVPTFPESEDPLARLTEEQKGLVLWFIEVIQKMPQRGPDTEALYKDLDASMPLFKESGIEMEKIMRRIKQMQTSVVTELHGRLIRIPGYLLPLETTGTKVREFLLVPYFGACIHVPPPPPNQIIHVKMTKGSYTSKGLFEPVWVTGVISTKAVAKDLYLTDGSAEIDIGYSVQADRVEVYAQ